MLVSSLDMTIVMDREEVLMTPKKKKKKHPRRPETHT